MTPSFPVPGPATRDRPPPRPPYAWELAPRPAPRRPAWRSWGLNLLLLVATTISVFFAGGPLLAAGLIAILFAHEMGHYVACRLYRVDATLPFFIPALWLPLGGAGLGLVPIPFVGTFGAVIRMRSRIPHRAALFDIGIAGPLAGFAVCLVVIVLGVLEAQIIARPDAGDPSFLRFGDPLLLQWAVLALRGHIPEDQSLLLGPLGLAAWFGLFVTALNLIPIGQLDGGHVTYALFRSRAAVISRIGSWVCLLLVYFGPNWLLWSLLLRVLGRKHPPTDDDEAPLGRGRVLVGVLGLLVFAVCFVPEPIAFSWRDFFSAVDLFGE